MPWLSRQKLEDTLRFTKILSEIDQIKKDQQEISGLVVKLTERLVALEASAKAEKRIAEEREARIAAEARAQSVKEAQSVVNAAQNQLNQRIEDIRAQVEDHLYKKLGVIDLKEVSDDTD